MTDTKTLSPEDEAIKLLGHMKTGLFSQLLIFGSVDQLDHLYINLLKQCQRENISTSIIEFFKDDPDFSYEYQKADLLFIKGLDLLPAMHDQSYSLRTLLDVGRHQGLRSFIFCEESQVKKHFNDYSAPFYRFCLTHRVNGY